MKRPAISVVTPSLDSVKYLDHCIRSVLAQREVPLEHIVIDGGSTDGTLQILAGYPSIRLIQEPDEGQAEALNRGFREARGDVIAWLNSDDMYLPDTLRIVSNAFESHPSVDLVYGAVELIDESGRGIGWSEPKDFSWPRVLDENPITQPGAFFRRSVFDRVGFLRTDLHYLMDYEFWLRVAKTANLMSVDSTLAQFRITPSSKTGSYALGFALEHLSLYMELFQDPWVLESHGHLQERLYGRKHWQIGLEFCRTGQQEKGRSHCLKAMNEFGLMKTERQRAVEDAVFAVSPNGTPPTDMNWLYTLLKAIGTDPNMDVELGRRMRAVFHLTRGFFLHTHGRATAGTGDLLRAVLLDRRHLRNRGIWRRLVDGILPEAITRSDFERVSTRSSNESLKLV